jgi:chromate transporter
MRSALVPLRTVAAQWGRIGCTAFGGPPAHISLLRQLCVDDRGWITSEEFEDAIASTNLLPGPASTQLAIFTGWSVAGPPGAVIGGICFIAPGLVIILVLAALFLSDAPPVVLQGAAAGAGAAVAAVAIHAAVGLVPASWKRAHSPLSRRLRWLSYLAAGVLAGASVGAWLVVVLLLCGVTEAGIERSHRRGSGAVGNSAPVLPLWMNKVPVALSATAGSAGLLALCWTAVKVGALSYGGGFVIVPLMQQDAVGRNHWMTNTQFLNAVALGQITPGPVVHTVAVVGFAAGGLLGGLLAALLAFSPSFLFILLGARDFGRLRRNESIRDFLAGAGPAAIGGIAGSAIPLATAVSERWQFGVLALAAAWLLLARRGVVTALLLAAALGAAGALMGLPLPG